jgi:hypothetical protein
MISSALQAVIVRTMMGLLAEHKVVSVEEKDLIAILMGAKLAADTQECSFAIKHLKQAEILQNGRGTKLNLSGTGLVLGTTVTLPPDVGTAIEEAMNSIWGGPNEHYAAAPDLT